MLEYALPSLRFEQRFPEPITEVFVALLRMLALRRWDPAVNASSQFDCPRPGTRYTRQTSTALREGRIVEVIRPVSVTLHETLHDPPCRVQLRQRWRVDTVEGGTQLRLELRYDLNQAATLRALHWRRRLRRHCERMIAFVGRNLEQARAETMAAPGH